ncbi:hypothetical protein [Halobacillus sp. Marseille-Q1614]|nr:hypothetical protein [Halobacillus sp. Marseille-Q1614]
MVTPAGTARAEDPLGQVIFLTKLASGRARGKHPPTSGSEQQTLTALLD